MKIKIRYFIISLVSLLLLVVVVDYLLGFPYIFSINRDLDLNSGDERVYVYTCFLKIKDKIQVTPFSQEIHRLGIDVPKKRKWIGTSTKLLRLITKRYICYVYGGVPANCNFLIAMFNKVNLPDENRRIILNEIMTILHSGNTHNVSKMITEKIQAESEKLLNEER